ncbi:hypothetical protein OY671_008776, partial [Metschnikowia pulcherrima]
DISSQIDGDTVESHSADAGAPTSIRKDEKSPALYVSMPMRDFSRKIAFFDIGEKEQAHFSTISRASAKHAPPASDRSYDGIAAEPALSGFFISQAMVEHAKQKQLDHWRQMFEGRPDDAYNARARRIGNIHAKIGSEPGWYIGAYAGVSADVIVAMAAGSGLGVTGSRKSGQAISAMSKMAMSDIEIALS